MTMFDVDLTDSTRVVAYTGGKYAASGSTNKIVQLWDPDTGKVF